MNGCLPSAVAVLARPKPHPLLLASAEPPAAAINRGSNVQPERTAAAALVELDRLHANGIQPPMLPAPVVSVITPTKNRSALLRETIHSVQAQTLQAWEHIIVDDRSSDATGSDVAALAQVDPRIRYLSRSGSTAGANACRNQGLAAARSDLIVFLDSDDLLDPGCLERRASVMQRNADLGFAVFLVNAFVQKRGDLGCKVNTDVLGDDLLRFLCFEHPWLINSLIWRRSVLQQLGGWDESLLSWQDIDLHVRALVSGIRYWRYPEIDAHARWQYEPTKVSIEQRTSPQHLQATSAIFDRFERLIQTGPGMTWTRQRALCSLYFFVAECWLQQGHRQQAIACWRRCRRRRLATASLYRVGSLLLWLQTPGSPLRPVTARLCHRWKGWVRLRNEPQLVDSA